MTSLLRHSNAMTSHCCVKQSARRFGSTLISEKVFLLASFLSKNLRLFIDLQLELVPLASNVTGLLLVLALRGISSVPKLTPKIFLTTKFWPNLTCGYSDCYINNWVPRGQWLGPTILKSSCYWLVNEFLFSFQTSLNQSASTSCCQPSEGRSWIRTHQTSGFSLITRMIDPG